MNGNRGTDARLRVTSSGIVHSPDCPRLRNNNAHTVPWQFRYGHDRACKTCNPVLPAADAEPIHRW